MGVSFGFVFDTISHTISTKCSPEQNLSQAR